jgi:membrane fusion protein (multidrug efflux system)
MEANTATKPKLSGNRKKIIQIGGPILGLIVLYFVFEFFMYVSTDNAQVNAHTVMLAPKVGGYITKVNVIEGQKVKKADVLAEIDDRDYKNALIQAQSELQSVDAKMKEAGKNFNRSNELFKTAVVSSQQNDAANSTYKDIKARYDAAASRVDQAQLNLDNTKIVAPEDGFIAKKSVEVGQLAAVGVPLIGFVGSSERWVIANFKETEIKDVHIGNKVNIEVDAISHESFEGEVESISAATGATFTLLPPDNATGNFTKVVQRVPVKIKMKDLTPEQIDRLQAGLSAVVKVHIH